MDLDSFFVSVERLLNPKLNGKPVLVGGNSDRAVVSSCSYEARKFGVHSAMPVRMAKQLCPDVLIVGGNFAEYTKYSHTVTDIIKESVPLFEKTSIDEFYMDLTGMDRFFGCYKLATEIRQRIMKETGLPISFALSANKTVSKIGTGEAKPNGQRHIEHGTEKAFLAPLKVTKIPMVGDKTYQVFRDLGFSKIYMLQELSVEVMQRLLGSQGVTIWQKANGIDNSPVIPYSERKSISSERTFDVDTIDIIWLKSVLVGLTERLAYQLRSEQKLTACVTVKIRYSDFSTHSMQAAIPYTSLDHLLIAKVKELFDKLYQKRMMIRLVGVRFSHLVQGSHQFSLFDETEQQVHLYEAMDKIRQRYGNHAIARAIATNLTRNNPNAFNGIIRDGD
jgi:DNA polymerase-4